MELFNQLGSGFSVSPLPAISSSLAPSLPSLLQPSLRGGGGRRWWWCVIGQAGSGSPEAGFALRVGSCLHLAERATRTKLVTQGPGTDHGAQSAAEPPVHAVFFVVLLLGNWLPLSPSLPLSLSLLIFIHSIAVATRQTFWVSFGKLSLPVVTDAGHWQHDDIFSISISYHTVWHGHLQTLTKGGNYNLILLLWQFTRRWMRFKYCSDNNSPKTHQHQHSKDFLPQGLGWEKIVGIKTFWTTRKRQGTFRDCIAGEDALSSDAARPSSRSSGSPPPGGRMCRFWHRWVIQLDCAALSGWECKHVWCNICNTLYARRWWPFDSVTLTESSVYRFSVTCRPQLSVRRELLWDHGVSVVAVQGSGCRADQHFLPSEQKALASR